MSAANAMWEQFDDMARLSREHIHDEIRTRYKLTLMEYLDANTLVLEEDSAVQQVDREVPRIRPR